MVIKTVISKQECAKVGSKYSMLLEIIIFFFPCPQENVNINVWALIKTTPSASRKQWEDSGTLFAGMKCSLPPISVDVFKIRRNTVEVTGLIEEIHLPLLLVLRSQAGRRPLAHVGFQPRWSCASSWSVPGMKAPLALDRTPASSGREI